MICHADEHYTIVRAGTLVARLVCLKCPFAVTRDSVSGANAPGWTGGKSGTPRYNRMRAIMAQHIHEKHPKENDRDLSR